MKHENWPVALFMLVITIITIRTKLAQMKQEINILHWDYHLGQIAALF
jgi:hypothetical protein